jgi:hypothetical protein
MYEHMAIQQYSYKAMVLSLEPADYITETHDAIKLDHCSAVILFKLP